MYLLYFYGSMFNIVSRRLDIIGIDNAIIITFPPISILDAIADSPESLQILTAYSVSIAIPVIFINNLINEFDIDVLFDILTNKLIIPDILSITNNNIIVPAIIDMYIVNSGLYCFIIILIITAHKPYAYYMYYFHFGYHLLFYRPNIVLTV